MSSEGSTTSMRGGQHDEGGSSSRPSSAMATTAPFAPRVAVAVDGHHHQPQQQQQQQQQQQHQHQSKSAFLPEPFPTAARANHKRHFHDAFGENDSGVDYGPPNEFEDYAGGDNAEEDDDGEEKEDVGGVEEGGEIMISGQEELLLHDKAAENAADDVDPIACAPLDQFADDTARDHSVGMNTAAMGDVAVEDNATTKQPPPPPTTTTTEEEEEVTIEELEEEVGLHETTLQSLTTKLQKLNNSIRTEESKSSSLRNDLQELNQRKLHCRKRTDNNLKLVKDLESSLEKCLERLRRAVDVLNHDHDDHGGGGAHGQAEEAVQEEEEEVSIGGVENTSISGSFGTYDAVVGPPNTAAPPVDDSAVNTITIPLKSKHQHKQLEIPLRGSSGHGGGGPEIIISYRPIPKLVRKILRESSKLPIDFPTWRTHQLSMSLLGGIDSIELIVDIMNVGVLEHLLKREEEEKEQPLSQSTSCGWVNKADIWGTSLDACTHVNWKHLFEGFRRVDESKNDINVVVANDDSNNIIDANVIVCPYELGGTCADDQCPYQHLRRRNDNDRDGIMARKLVVTTTTTSGSYRGGGGDGGYVRYNNFPKAQLPRSFSKHDFIMRKRGGGGGGGDGHDEEEGGEIPPSTKSTYREGREELRAFDGTDTPNAHQQQQQPDNRLYHCPVCVDQKTFTREELQVHLTQCKSSTLTVGGKVVTVQHVLQQTPQEARVSATSLAAFYGNDSNNTVREHSNRSDSEDRSLSPEIVDNGPFDRLNKPEEGDDAASTTSSGSDNSARRYHSTSGTEDHYLSADSRGQLPESRKNCDVEDNLDYVSLPSVADSIEGRESHDDNAGLGEERAIFSDIFWWQQLNSYPAPTDDDDDDLEDSRNNFDHLLLAFGFQRRRMSGAEGTSYSLWYLGSNPFEGAISTQEQNVEDILLLSRLVDLSRVLVHMGRDHFALLVMSGICEFKKSSFNALLEDVSRAIKSLLYRPCALSQFHVQVQLLVISESLHAHYDFLCGKDTAGSGLSLETLFDLIRNLNLSMFAEKQIFSAGFDNFSQKIMSHLPSTQRERSSSVEGDDEWEALVTSLRLMMEKFVIVPFSQLKASQHHLFLMQCVCIGKFLSHLVKTASNHKKFAPYLHTLEPIWSSLQLLLQRSTGCHGRLRPDLVAIILIGPVLFSCVADTIALPSGESTTSQKLPPEFDARALANLSSLDNFILGILKELDRFGRHSNGRCIELLMSPIHALSATICVALGSFEKALVRLEHILNKGEGSSTSKQPSMYALSEMIWSQLVQIRMICPSYCDPLKRTDKSNRLSMPLLPDTIIETHREIASRIVENGIFLWGVKLRGDSHMNVISPCFNQMNCKEWEKAAAQIFKERHPIETGGCYEEVQTHSSVEFRLAEPYPKLDGVEGRASVFPESLLLLGKTLTHLSLNDCELTRLPFSIGHHLSNLQLLNVSNNRLREIPSSICFMACLEVLNVSCNYLETFPKLSHCRNLRVIDVSHNQLASFPSDLALQCHNLQSFLVDGNPASDVLPPQQKRQKVGQMASDYLR